TTLWTGNGSDRSFNFAINQNANSGTFASSHEGSTVWDFCNGMPDQASMVHVYYRETLPAPALNTPAQALASCQLIQKAGSSLGDGVYWLVQDGGAPYRAYCD